MHGMHRATGGMHGTHGLHGLYASAAVNWLLVSLCVLVGGVCLLRAHRLRGAAGSGGAGAAGEAWMGFAMAAMALEPVSGGLLPTALPAALAGAGLLGESALAVRELTRCPSGGGHRLHHLLGAAVMAYMAWRMARGDPATGSAEQALTAAATVYFAGYALLSGVRLLPAPAPASVSAPESVPVPAPAPSPEAYAGGPYAAARLSRAPYGTDPPVLAAACRTAMATATAAMLLAM